MPLLGIPLYLWLLRFRSVLSALNIFNSTPSRRADVHRLRACAAGMHAAHDAVHGPRAARRLGPPAGLGGVGRGCRLAAPLPAAVHLHGGCWRQPIAAACACNCCCNQPARRTMRRISLRCHRRIACFLSRCRSSCRRGGRGSGGCSGCSSGSSNGGSGGARSCYSVGDDGGSRPRWDGGRHHEQLLQGVGQLVLAAVVLPRRQEHLAETLDGEGRPSSEAVQRGEVPLHIHRRGDLRRVLLLHQPGRRLLLRCVARSILCCGLRLRLLRRWRLREGVQRLT